MVGSKKGMVFTAIGLFIIAFAIRYINLSTFLTADEPRSWFKWSINFAQALLEGRGGETFFNYTPGVTLMWLGMFGLYLAYLLNPAQSESFLDFLNALPLDPIDTASILWFRLPAILIGSLCIALAYLLMRRLLGHKVALLGALLLALDPLHIGMTRVLGNDALTASLMLISTLAMLIFFFKPTSRPYLILSLSAVTAGLAILAKTTAIFMLPMVGLIILVALLYDKNPKLILKYSGYGLLWGLLTVLTVIVLWPALWFEPLATLQSITTRLGAVIDQPHNRGSFFMGQPIPDPGPWFYWTISFFRLTLINTVGLLLASAYLLSGLRQDTAPKITRSNVIVVLLWAFILFYLIFLSTGSKKQDRYMVPIIPMVNFLAAVGYVWLAEKLPFKHSQAALFTTVLLVQVAITWLSAPYYLSHYNILAGGGRTADKTVLVGWGEGLDLAADYLNSQPQAETIKASAWYHSTFEPYFVGQAIERAGDEKISRSAKPALSSDYVVLYVNQIQRKMPTPGMIQYYQSFTAEHIVTINGIDYVYIYPSAAMDHAFSGQVRLVGQAELLGYRLLDEEDHPISTLPADQTATIQLYWEWQGKTPAEEIRLSLVDLEGQVWGEITPLGSNSPLPYQNWAEGAIVHDEFTLQLWPGIPPADYFLKAWIDRPASNERVGDFPLQLEDTQITVTRPNNPPLINDLPLSNRLNTPFLAKNITLLGFTNNKNKNQPWQPSEARDLTLYWQANTSNLDNFDISLYLLDKQGVNQAKWDGLPAGNFFQPNQWEKGDIIRAPWKMTLPTHVPPGDYQLTLQLKNEPPLELLTVAVAGRPRQFEVPAVDLVLNQTYQDAIELWGLQTSNNSAILDLTPASPLDLKLVWQATGAINTDYTITAQLLDGQGQVRAQRDGVPLNGSAPTSSWSNGEVIIDSFSLDIPADIGASPHQLLIALYQAETGQRLSLPDGSDHLTIPIDSR